MRRILVENARRKQRLCHGGAWRRVDLDQVDPASDAPSHDLLDLDAALDKLTAEEPAAADVVKLRYFAGLTIEQTAAALNLSVATTNRHWAFARAWLYRRLQGGERGD